MNVADGPRHVRQAAAALRAACILSSAPKLLGTTGDFLRAVYRDTIDAAVPPELQELVDRLHDEPPAKPGRGHHDETVGNSKRGRRRIG